MVKLLHLILISLLFVLIAHLYVQLKGPSFSEPVPGLPPWPIFKIATRISNFLRLAYIGSNPGALLSFHHGIIYTSAMSLYVIAKLGVADYIQDSAVDYKEIAMKVKANPMKLHRIIRYLSSEGYFILSNDGKVSLTNSGQYLRSDRADSMRYCFIHWNEEASQSMHYMLNEVKNEGEAFEMAFNKDLFSLFQERPESTEAFTKCMAGMFSFINPSTSSEYDYSQHHTLLDLGGGMGYATSNILSIYDKNIKPNSNLTKAIVFDLDEVIKNGNQKHEIMQYQSGSFFDLSTIPRGADVILINGVIHDWNDEESIQILNNAASVLETNGKVIVIDSIVPDSSSNPFYNAITRLDVFMMTVSSGYFRTYEEYSSLFLKTNLKLKETRESRSINSLFILEKV